MKASMTSPGARSGSSEMPSFEIPTGEVRKQRNAELRDTDWRAVKDRVLPTAWKDYRQALRDLPQNHDEANDAADAWPVMPDA